MPAEPLPNVPRGSDIFIDANVFVYGLMGVSGQCQQLLDRCSRDELTGISLFLAVNEATHRLMLAEAKSRAFITHERAVLLRQHHPAIQQLTDYWQQTERILSLNVLFLAESESLLRAAQQERQAACLLVNDSIIVSCMRGYGIRYLATNDRDFERVAGITVFRPDDLP